MKSKDFLRSKGILSNDSDHYIINFHDGREINLGDLLEEYAQQSQPSGMRWVDDVNKIRGQAKAFGDKYSGSISEQAAAEVGFNAAINQVINILSEPSPAGAAEGASEGMAGAVKFAKFLADNDYRPGSGNKHWFKWNGMEVDETPLTLEQVYQIFASLSPGVEDNQTKKQ